MAGPGQSPKQFSNATFSDDNGIGMVTVVSTAGDVASAGEWVRIIVYVPALGDVKVRNAGGHVNVVNAHGEVDIQNSTTSLGFGHIMCASIHPTKSTLLLSTDDGTIDVSIPASSQFKLDATTGAGEVMISARNSIVTEAVERPMNWTGVVNGGTAAATLRTSKGNIKIRIGAAE